MELYLEKAEAEVAKQEWQQLNPGTEPPSPLIVRQPQIRQAQTRLKATKAQLATTKLNLERTNISLPFEGRIANETVDLGQFVTVGQSIGKAYGIDAVEIQVPLEDRELAWFDVPVNPISINDKTSPVVGAKVEVKSDFAGSKHTWQGRAIRTTGQIDKTSRLVSVVVEVSKPFQRVNNRPPLVPGMFVELFIKGKILKNVLLVPRHAIHDGKKVWVVREGKLHIKEPEIIRKDHDFVYVVSGLKDQEAIVISSLDAVTNAMNVRTDRLSEDTTETK